MTAREEQETTITAGRTDDVVRIHTSDMRHLLRLRKLASTKDFVTEVRGGTDWAEFEVKVEFFHVFSAIRAKKQLSEAAAAAAGARLAAARVKDAA